MDRCHEKAILFEVPTPLGFRVPVTRSCWDLITTIKQASGDGRARVHCQEYPANSGTDPRKPQQCFRVPLLPAGTNRQMDLCSGKKPKR